MVLLLQDPWSLHQRDINLQMDTFSLAITQLFYSQNTMCECLLTFSGVSSLIELFANPSIFVIDRSSSMRNSDRKPLPNTPVTATISARCDNRLGAVYSALYAFWKSREARHQNNMRHDAYSVVLFDNAGAIGLANDFQSSPQDLLNTVLPFGPGYGTNFGSALESARSVMEEHWAPDRYVR